MGSLCGGKMKLFPARRAGGVARPLLVIGGIIVLAVAMAWFAGVFTPKISPEATAEAAIPTVDLSQYALVPVEVREKPFFQEAMGTLRAARRTNVAARVMARIVRISVRAGDPVEAGQVIIELDREAFEAQLRQAEAALEAAKASFAQALDQYQRAQRVRETNPGAISQQEFNALESQYRAAEANRAKAEQAVAEARVRLDYTTIRAPQNGIVVDRLAEEGDIAQPGVPLLTIYDPRSLRLEVAVMENLGLHVNVGDRLRVYVDSLKREFEGIVDEKVPQAEAMTRSFLIKVKLPEDPALFEGMFGRLVIPAGVRRHLCLHSGAIERIGQLEFVKVLLDRNTGAVERRLIKTGQRGYGAWVEVLSGLSPGEAILVPKATADQMERELKEMSERAAALTRGLQASAQSVAGGSTPTPAAANPAECPNPPQTAASAPQ
ncbi:MAG: efflux RND transporter periplasmic adaptor subunit [Thermoguttaceae bacterium]|nr:efflux RND transporter periplasmic adaptor subunit [Thermoguttaceae bacterium]MDW8077707.1 efflux RND transporter periplasmic adaptor subunit [Thermoguttaceae bacterium]